ncbi:MAG: glycoside hydrolase family 1 protein [Flavobacteriales bacterium]|nr:glycoside hydrolase family 1 protein [Flavobacteriales bacterium]
MRAIAITVAILLLAYLLPTAYLNYSEPVLKWDWASIDLDDLSFPEGFIWGVASAAHQVEGGHTGNNWAAWEQGSYPDGRPHILNNEETGAACEHWERYPEDIRLMQELGVSSYRFSVSWSKIMPQEGVIDSVALQHYVDVCDSLAAVGISPMVTLHHFEHPLWFEEKGAFEKVENIGHFVHFSDAVFNALKDRVTFWCTINEPAVFVIAAYFDGNFPPGKQDPQLAAIVLKNLFKAHVAVYQHLKSLPGGERAQIGIVKNMHQIDPVNEWSLLDRLLARTVNNGFNGSFITTFRDGHYRFHFPTLVDEAEAIADAPSTLDFVGLNYYSHNGMAFSPDLDEALKTRMYPGETPTDMTYTIYPEGLYRAIQEISVLGRPIIITENGIADAKDDRRGDFIRRYIYAVSKAIEDGYDVRGFHYWSLTDNFEWDLGYGQRFGLYHVDFATQKRTLREGSKEFQRIVKAHSNWPDR